MLRILSPLAGKQSLGEQPVRSPLEDSTNAITLQPLLHSTASLPPERQFEVIRAFYDGVFEVVGRASGEIGFAATQRAWSLGRCALVAASLQGTGQRLAWSPARGTTLDHCYVVQPCRFIEGRALPPAETRAPEMHSLAHHHAVKLEGESALLLFMPRCNGEVAEAGAPGVARDDALLGLLGDMMLALFNRLPTLEAHALGPAVDAVMAVAGGIAVGPARSAPVGGLTLVERAKRLIRARLAEPDLSPDLICRELGVSRSRLYRLFETLGGISSYVRRQRLLRARHALADPHDMRPIMVIAEQWGFADPSVFSRSFRNEFGVSPRAVREAGVFQPTSASRRAGARRASGNLAALLRELAV